MWATGKDSLFSNTEKVLLSWMWLNLDVMLRVIKLKYLLLTLPPNAVANLSCDFLLLQPKIF